MPYVAFFHCHILAVKELWLHEIFTRIFYPFLLGSCLPSSWGTNCSAKEITIDHTEGGSVLPLMKKFEDFLTSLMER